MVALAFGLAFFVPLLRWSGTFVGPVPWLLLALLQALLLAPLGPLPRCRPAPAGLAAVASRPAGWPPRRCAAGSPFGGFPWGRLAFSQGHTTFTGWAAWGGAPLVTFVARADCGALLAAARGAPAPSAPTAGAGRRAGCGGAVRRRSRLALAVAASGLGVAAVPDGTRARREAVVALVQGNVPRLGLAAGAQARQVLANHLDATTELAERVRAGELPAPEVVLWPENATDLDPLTDPEVAAAAGPGHRRPGRAGARRGRARRPGPLHPQRRAWSGSPAAGRARCTSSATRCPFGEYIPLRSLARRVSDKVDLVARDFAAGDTPGVHRRAGGRGRWGT